MTALLIIIYVSFISLGLPDTILGSAWPVMQESLHAPLALAGYLSMTVTMGTVISSICCDWAVSKFGTGRVTAVSVIMTAVALAGFSVSPNAVCLFLCAVPLGLGAGCVDAALNNFVALHYEAKHMSWLHCFWGIGASVGPMLVSATLRAGNSWRSGYGIIAGLQAALCVVLIATQRLWRKDGVKTAVEDAAAPKWKRSELFRLPGVVPALAAFTLYSAAETTTGLWGASYLHQRFAVSAADAAVTSTVIFGSMTVGRLLSGFAARRWSDETLIRIGQTACLTGAVLTILAPAAWVALLGIGLMGLGFAPIYPSMLHQTPRRFGAARSQSVMGLEMASAYLGSTCFPPLFGILAGRFTTSLYPWYLLALAAAMLVCSEIAGRQLRYKAKQASN